MSTQPARLATLIVRASRFWARVRAFDLECPNCGTVTLVGQGRKCPKAWNQILSQLVCPGCERTWVVGLTLWSVKPGIGAPVQPARDHVPGERVKAQLRQLIPTFWPTKRVSKVPQHTNLTIEEIED